MYLPEGEELPIPTPNPSRKREGSETWWPAGLPSRSGAGNAHCLETPFPLHGADQAEGLNHSVRFEPVENPFSTPALGCARSSLEANGVGSVGGFDDAQATTSSRLRAKS